MENTSIFGVEKVYESSSSAFKIISFAENIKLDTPPTNILKLSISSKGSYINNFESLEENYTTVLSNIFIRVDYLDKSNTQQYYTTSITKVVNICSGEYVYSQDCIIGVNILDLQILKLESNTIDLSITFHLFLDT